MRTESLERKKKALVERKKRRWQTPRASLRNIVKFVHAEKENEADNNTSD
jgi:hypothetical protein